MAVSPHNKLDTTHSTFGKESQYSCTKTIEHQTAPPIIIVPGSGLVLPQMFVRCLVAVVAVARCCFAFVIPKPTTVRSIAFAKKKTAGSDVMSSAALVAGNMVGGGILALPTATYPIGVAGAGAEIGILWCVNVATGLLLAEVACSRSREAATLQELTQDRLGEEYGAAVGALFCGSNALLMSAYASEGGEALGQLLGGSLDSSACRAVFFAAFIAAVSCSDSTIEKMNTVGVAVMALTFSALLASWLPLCDWSSATSSFSAEGLVEAAPVVTSALVFHNCVPVVAYKLGGSRLKTFAAIILGSALPATAYVLFDAAVLGRIDTVHFGTDGLLDPLSGLADPSFSSAVLASFSLVAISTSLVGTAQSQIHEFGGAGDNGKIYTLALPLLISTLGPSDLFVQAVGLNGAIANPLLFGLLPVALALSTRSRQPAPSSVLDVKEFRYPRITVDRKSYSISISWSDSDDKIGREGVLAALKKK